MGDYDHLTLDDGSPLTEQEKWVLEQVRKGLFADLKEKFGEKEEDRVLRANFLGKLLTDDFKDYQPHRRGIRVANAVIPDLLDLEDAQVPYITDLDTCIFRQDVNFRDSYFTRHLFLNDSTFEKGADFHRVRVELSLLCRNAGFHGPMNFGSADIKEQFNADGGKFESKEHEANFNSMKVGQSAFFREAVFRGPVDFGSADIKEQFCADGAKFESQDHKANFNSMKVGQNAFFRNAIFKGPVDFGNADIGGQFNAKGAQFQGQEEKNKANFNGMKVGQDAFFSNAIFKDPVDFVGADIRGQFNADGAHFESQDHEANFNSMKVGQSAFFREAVFQGPLDFVGANIVKQFNADGAKFESQDHKANFNSMKVGQNAFFNGVIFQGPVNFTLIKVDGNFRISSLEVQDQQQPTTFHGPITFRGAVIKGQFSAYKAQFLHETPADFEGIKVELSALFRDAVFHGIINLNHAGFLDLILIPKTTSPPIPRLNLEGTVVQRELRIGNAQIDVLQASHLQVKGPATFENVTMKQSVDLRDSTFQTLNLIKSILPKNEEEVWLEGLTYNAINAGTGKEDWKKLLAWIKGSRFNTQVYSQLEAYFSRCGHLDRADEVFISGKREAAKRLTWGKKWLTRIFWGGLAGYGRKPWQVLYVILPLVALGTFLFAPEFTAKSLESYGWLNQMKQNHPWIIQFLVSLDRFLPGVDLGLAKEWSPACVGLFTFAYWYFLKLAGWITIPIALAAIYTRIK